MGDRTRSGLGILAASVALGLLGDLLLTETPWGFNALLWVLALLGAIILLSRLIEGGLKGTSRWLLLPAAIFSLCFAWRDSMPLKMLDALALLITLSLSALNAQSVKLRLAGFLNLTEGLLISGYNGIFAPFLISFSDIEWRDVPRGGASRHALAVGRGLVIALPLLFVFGSLLVAADAVFEGLVLNVIDLSFASVIRHSLFTVFFAWIVSGSLRSVLLKNDLYTAAYAGTKTFSLGIIEVGITLGMLNLLFLAFVVVQFQYLFGGTRVVDSTSELTYAEYARRGFFELVTVAALVLPLLLLLHWLLRKDNPAHERLFRLLAGAQVLMLFAIMASAVERMRLYVNEYGLTQLRLYTTAFMLWLAVIFLWFAVTVLRGQRQRFAFGALVTGLALIAMLHALNPDSLIVRTNAARKAGGHSFDAYYASSLSADAVPALIETLPALTDQERCRVAENILREWTPLEHSDWRTWSWSRSRAWRAVNENGTYLWGIACWAQSTSR